MTRAAARDLRRAEAAARKAAVAALAGNDRCDTREASSSGSGAADTSEGAV